MKFRNHATGTENPIENLQIALKRNDWLAPTPLAFEPMHWMQTNNLATLEPDEIKLEIRSPEEDTNTIYTDKKISCAEKEFTPDSHKSNYKKQ